MPWVKRYVHEPGVGPCSFCGESYDHTHDFPETAQTAAADSSESRVVARSPWKWPRRILMVTIGVLLVAAPKWSDLGTSGPSATPSITARPAPTVTVTAEPKQRDQPKQPAPPDQAGPVPEASIRDLVVPYLVGLEHREAEFNAKNLGFLPSTSPDLQVGGVPTDLGPLAECYVTGQYPRAGTKVRLRFADDKPPLSLKCAG